MRGILVLAAVALLAGPVVAADAVHSVSIQNFQYHPPVLQIAVGDTVTWTNLDGGAIVHTATYPPSVAGLGGFDSGDLREGQSFSHTFDASGVFPYICLHHPFMAGLIVVQ